MTIIEATQNFVAKLTGIAERMEAALKSAETSSAELATANARILDLEGQVETITAERDARPTAEAHQDLQTELAEAKAVTPGKVNAEAARALAAAGTPPVTATNGEGEGGAKSVKQQFDDLAAKAKETGARADIEARNAFYAKHEREIDSAIRR